MQCTCHWNRKLLDNCFGFSLDPQLIRHLCSRNVGTRAKFQDNEYSWTANVGFGIQWRYVMKYISLFYLFLVVSLIKLMNKLQGIWDAMVFIRFECNWLTNNTWPVHDISISGYHCPHENKTRRLYRLSMGCHTVSPAPVWVRIPGP